MQQCKTWTVRGKSTLNKLLNDHRPKMDNVIIQDPAQFGQRLISLPTEILDLIFESVPKPQLKALRTTCRAFEDSTTGLLFHTLILAPRKRQLRVFKNIANHPILRSKVRHLSYDLSLYSAFHRESTTSPYVYEKEFEKQFGRHQLNTSKHISASLQYFGNLCDDEERIIRTSEEAQILSKYLHNLQKLQKVSISYDYKGPYRYSTAPPIAPAASPYYIRYPGNGNAILFLFRALRKANIPIQIFSLR